MLPRTFFGRGYQDYDMIAFWSREITQLIELIIQDKGRAFATHHDRGLECLNTLLFQKVGEFNHDYRVAGRQYHDLMIPIKHPRHSKIIIEYKLRSSGLKYLKDELSGREKVFSHSDWLFFSFFLQKEFKEKDKSFKMDGCIYYLVVVLFPKRIVNSDLRHLVKTVKMDSDNFIKELTQASKVDAEREELRPIENIITVVELKKRLEAQGKQLEQKDKQLEAKDKQIKHLKEQLRQK